MGLWLRVLGVMVAAWGEGAVPGDAGASWRWGCRWRGCQLQDGVEMAVPGGWYQAGVGMLVPGRLFPLVTPRWHRGCSLCQAWGVASSPGVGLAGAWGQGSGSASDAWQAASSEA